MKKFFGIGGLVFFLASKGSAFSPVMLARWTDWAGGSGVPEVYLSEDGGASWELRGEIPDTIHGSDGGLALGLSPAGNLYLIHLNAEDSIVSPDDEVARFYFSSDTGKTWEKRDSIILPKRYDIASAGIAVLEDTCIYAYLLGYKPVPPTDTIDVYKSTDGGFNWSVISTFPVPISSQDAEGEMALGCDTTLYIAEWTDATSQPTVYKSTDYGNNWSLAGYISSDSSTSNARSTAIVSTAEELYACVWSNITPLKVYHSTDEGVTWQFLDTVLVDVSVDDGIAGMGATRDSLLYIAAWDHAKNTLIFRSDDDGVTWSEVGQINGVAAMGSASLAFAAVEPACGPPAGVEETSLSKGVQRKFALHAGMPNPTKNRTTIRYSIPVKAHVKISIYDLTGSLVEILVNEEKASGYHKVTWDAGVSGEAIEVPSGIYFVRLIAGNYKDTKKLILVR